MATEDLAVRLMMKSDQYVRESKKAASATSEITKSAESATTKTQGLGKSMFNAGSLIKGAAVTGAFFALADGISSAVDSAEEAASIMANTEQIIVQTGGAANVTADDVADLSSRLSALTGVEDDLVQEGANVLLTFKNIRNEVGEGNDVFDRTAGLMLDLGAVMGTDAKTGALQLGKALNDPVANMGALSRAGLQFSDQQKDQIKQLVASNDLLGAQTLILDELESQLGGTAEESAKASEKLGNVFGELVEAAGGIALPFLESVAIELQNIAGLTDDLDRVASHAGGAAESAEALLTAVADMTGGSGFVSGFGKSIEEFFLILIPGIDRMDRFRDSVTEMADRLSPGELQRAIDGIDLLKAEFGLTAEEGEVLAEILRTQLLQELAALEASEADKYLRGGLNPAMEELGEETETTAVNLADLNTQINTLIDPAFAALDALNRVEEAQAELNSVLAEYPADSAEAQEAGQNLIESYGDLVAAADRYSQESGQDIKTALFELGEQAGVPRDVIAALVQELNKVDGFVANAQVNVSIDQFGSLDSRIRVGGFRAAGGPVRAGVPYVVGEQGPEIFTPSQSGHITANGAMAGVTVAVYGNVYADDLEDHVVSAVEKARRRGVAV